MVVPGRLCQLQVLFDQFKFKLGSFRGRFDA